ncbi:PQQ-binding-like beta-propeller repeat protein [Bdellovibrio sp. HCB337]|uniref:outer membrane protein assembly factor BamB family protein n=1 Tax=Bdellovibrio sp. HCB337 TaxID=3394358 RepID=UPI0039A70E11
MKKSSLFFVVGLFSSTLLTGCSTFENLLSRTAEKREFQVREVWVRQGPQKDNLGFRKINRMTPLIVGDLLIEANALDGMVAYHRDGGHQVWRLNVLNGVEAGAALVNDRLFFGASDGSFYSVNAKTGKVLWTFPTRTENISEPFLDTTNGIVYFISGANVVYALDAESGRQVWLYSRQDNSNFSIRGGSKPALKDGNLFVGFSDGTLVSLNAKTGNLQWELPLNKNKKFRDIDAAPVVDGDQIFVSGYDDKLYCINAGKGDIQWKIDGGGYYPVTISGDKIYYSTTSGEVWALQRGNGDKIWSYKVPEGVPTQAKVYKGLAVFGESQGALKFLDANTGKQVSSYSPGRGIMSTPLVDDKNNHIYFISGEANVYAMEAKWSYPQWIPYLQ